ncbi:MAG: 50S ribosomal protein L11 methyltransferase [Solirubrobacteraceae bacterium]
MREVVLRLRADALDVVLDRILPLVPGGVRERQLDREEIELRMRGEALPELAAFRRALGPLRVAISESSVSDDFRQRRLADYRPDVIGGRLVVRPPWAPAAAAGLIEIVLEEGAAFGAGTHPTTSTCLELLLRQAAGGSFADLGCGSGVLAILAARLGWSPVTALDLQPDSVTTAGYNASANGVEITARSADLLTEPPPACDAFAANVPVAVHGALAAVWHQTGPPRSGLASGFGPDRADTVAAAYAACGLAEGARHIRDGWVVAELVAR